jgi:hypothetical protein
MSPPEKAGAWVADLALKLREDAGVAAEQASLASEELGRAASDPPPRAVMAFVSVCIERGYSALEAGFQRIARLLDENLPSGSDWHKALLHQMTLPIQDRRPPVLSAATALALDVLRRHRHWLRHAYAASFEWTHMKQAALAFPGAVESARLDLDRFVSFLEARD